jgi:hypothetical protein
MKPLCLVFCSLPILVLPAQGPAPAPSDARVTHRTPLEKSALDAGRPGLASPFDDPDFVVLDQPQADGPLWAAARDYKAAFDSTGWQFIGRPAKGAPDLQPVRFRFAGAQVGGRALAVAPSAPVRADRRIEFRHGDVVQAVDVGGRGVEQTFTISALPQRGELVLRIEVDTALACTQDERGIRFHGPYDEVGYSPAVAIDASGERIAAPTALQDGGITIRVPADFVERAHLPLVIDPFVTGLQVFTTSGDLADPDIAWDETGQVWAIVFSRYFGAADWDCYVQRLNNGNPMNYVGGLIPIDTSTDGWQLPRIANLGVYDVFLIVSQVRWAGPSHVVGRIIGNSGVVVTGQFDIAASTVDELRPDVGGNQSVPPPVQFTVVWEHSWSAADHDIYARQVSATGVLGATTYVQTNTANQSWPSISKSCGPAPASTQRFGIVYQQLNGFGDQDIYGALLTANGAIVPVGGSNTFPINDTWTENDVMPQISSPTIDSFGRRILLAVYERTNSHNGDILATAIDHNGAILASGNINVLEYDPVGRLSWPQHRPSVDCDGIRFVVGYHELVNNNPTANDLDTKVSLVAVAGNSLTVGEPGVPIAVSGAAREFNVQVATEYSGTGNHGPGVGLTNDRDTFFGTFAIDAFRYAGIPWGGYGTRATACGSLAIQSQGLPTVGSTITFTMSGVTGLSGYVVGLPASAPIGPCPQCTLGVNGSVVINSSFVHYIGLSPAYIGWVFSVQAFAFDTSGGPCLGAIHVSDTIDVTVL